MLTELKFTDFYIDPFAFMVVVDTLINHPTLNTIDFSRNEINEDTACAVIQKLYGNASLRKLNLDGNPISIALFKENILKPYFSGRKDLKIVLA